MFNNLIIVVWEAASRVEAILHGECMYACVIYMYIYCCCSMLHQTGRGCTSDFPYLHAWMLGWSASFFPAIDRIAICNNILCPALCFHNNNY